MDKEKRQLMLFMLGMVAVAAWWQVSILIMMLGAR